MTNSLHIEDLRKKWADHYMACTNCRWTMNLNSPLMMLCEQGRVLYDAYRHAKGEAIQKENA